jgi:hypothetical protein
MNSQHKATEYCENMTLEQYAEERITFNIERYRKKARRCRDTYLYTNFGGLLLTSAVPILINLPINKLTPTIVSIISCCNCFWKKSSTSETDGKIIKFPRKHLKGNCIWPELIDELLAFTAEQPCAIAFYALSGYPGTIDGDCRCGLHITS